MCRSDERKGVEALHEELNHEDGSTCSDGGGGGIKVLSPKYSSEHSQACFTISQHEFSIKKAWHDIVH